MSAFVVGIYRYGPGQEVLEPSRVVPSRVVSVWVGKVSSFYRSGGLRCRQRNQPIRGSGTVKHPHRTHPDPTRLHPTRPVESPTVFDSVCLDQCVPLYPSVTWLSIATAVLSDLRYDLAHSGHGLWYRASFQSMTWVPLFPPPIFCIKIWRTNVGHFLLFALLCTLLSIYSFHKRRAKTKTLEISVRYSSATGGG